MTGNPSQQQRHSRRIHDASQPSDPGQAANREDLQAAIDSSNTITPGVAPSPAGTFPGPADPNYDEEVNGPADDPGSD